MSRPGLSKRLPTILTEVISVIFAVLVALAVDQWWEERENLQLAERTQAAIAQEIRKNRAKLLSDQGTGGPEPIRAGLDSAIAAYREGREPDEVGVNWDVALLSSAAWETARITPATQYIELDRLIDLAEVYEFQRFYIRRQDELVSLIGGIESRIETEPVRALLEFRSRLAVAESLRRTLAASYACTLVEMEGEAAVEEGACPRGDSTDQP